MKKNISKIHYEILDEKRLDLLKDLTPLTKDFVLSGGTALAMQIKHRLSFDFDFFTGSKITANFLAQLEQKIKITAVSVNNPDEVTIFGADNIKVSFIYYPFKKTHKLLKLDNGLKIYSLKDIAGQKAYTIGRRGAYRDYYDIYALINDHHLMLKEIIQSAQTIYQAMFNPKLFLEQLVYFDDLENYEIIAVDKTRKIPEPAIVKAFLKKEVAEYINKEILK